jgi:hypothetical protein
MENVIGLGDTIGAITIFVTVSVHVKLAEHDNTVAFKLVRLHT